MFKNETYRNSLSIIATRQRYITERRNACERGEVGAEDPQKRRGESQRGITERENLSEGKIPLRFYGSFGPCTRLHDTVSA